MSYYPNNLYQNYPYGNNYPQYTQPAIAAQPQMQTQPTALPSTNLNQQSVLQGKIVDGEEIVRATEVPFGGYGVFPKADLSEIYIKTWNNDGTTKVVTYTPILTQTTDSVKSVSMNDILTKMEEIEKKIDSITEKPKAQVVQIQQPNQEKGKEITANAY